MRLFVQWMPPGSAERKAAERAEAAILDVLTPICVARFHGDTERETKLEALKKVNSWKSGRLCRRTRVDDDARQREGRDQDCSGVCEPDSRHQQLVIKRRV